MVKASSEIQTWINGLPAPQQKPATEALLSLLKELFERNTKIQIFWGKKVQEADDFYVSFPIMGTQKTALEDLIVWARRNVKKADGPDPIIPHVAIRKWTLTTELGIGVTGFGVAAAMIPMEYSDGKYYGQGASVILGGSALVDKHSWLFDMGGAIIGGVAAGLLYGFLVKPNPWEQGPIPPPPGPGTKYPVDPYGP
jgi:hypothetical protein